MKSQTAVPGVRAKHVRNNRAQARFYRESRYGLWKSYAKMLFVRGGDYFSTMLFLRS